MAELAESAMLTEQHSCPNAHPPVDGQAYAKHGSLCKDSTCTLCPEAGSVWSPSGFCSPGQWKKKTSEQPLDPKVWKNIPLELLEIIFTHLPTAAICRMRALSKDWNRALSSSSPTFKTNAKLQPSFCALLGFSARTQKCWVRVYDTQERKWHAFTIDSIPSSYSARSIIVCDAGLACIVPCGEKLHPILICNPLTKEWRELPLQTVVFNHSEGVLLAGERVRMVQLRVNQESGAYRVTLSGDDGAEGYDSQMNEWSKTLLGKTWGVVFLLTREYPTEWDVRSEYGIYDASTGEWLFFTDAFEYFERVPNSRGVVGPQVEVILQWADQYRAEFYLLLEFIGGPGQDVLFNVLKYGEGCWRFPASGGLPEFMKDPVIFEFVVDKTVVFRDVVKLMVCETFFLVFCQDHFQPKYHIKFCDMETKKWAKDFDLECSEEWPSVSGEDIRRGVICELRWDARL